MKLRRNIVAVQLHECLEGGSQSPRGLSRRVDPESWAGERSEAAGGLKGAWLEYWEAGSYFSSQVPWQGATPTDPWGIYEKPAIYRSSNTDEGLPTSYIINSSYLKVNLYLSLKYSEIVVLYVRLVPSSVTSNSILSADFPVIPQTVYFLLIGAAWVVCIRIPLTHTITEKVTF